MLAQCVQTGSRKRLRLGIPQVDSDPAYLSAKLRELALKTYHAVRTGGDNQPANEPAGPDLVVYSRSRLDWLELHREILQLERALDAQRLHSLAAYVGALRQKVESRLP